MFTVHWPTELQSPHHHYYPHPPSSVIMWNRFQIKKKLPPVNGHPLWFDQQNYLSNPKPESEKKYCRILSLFSSRKPLKGNCFHNGKWPPLSAQSIIWTPTSVHLRLLILAIICVPEFNVPFIRSTYESAHQTHVKRNCLNSTLWMKN